MTNPNNSEFEPLTRPQVLTIMGVTAILLLLVAKVWQYLGSVALFPLSFTLEAVLIGLGLATGIILASGLIYRIWPAYRESAQYYLNLVLKPLALPDSIWLGLLPGLSEELLFRGVMIPALGSGIIAVIISSVLFGVLHLGGAQQWPYGVWATSVGFVLGAVMIATGNLLIPIIAHIMTNFVSGLLWKLENR
ncbi:CPBP family intramembrane metalloprotease [Euhalothece natronophila Z-M001]|uniref:CPBP family intramembrane metalloprotease n=1 Tax=Euhalothece natronophila Z-M001 TaxID=522448 RepID=A0A5B8NLY5_9CHRO|nr:CPBP family intramembrane glutamic endopeptidase [Euhalothece natronophila]QDZ40054.1 CPBP family intramembrane metalloprotease [Euhalothece natronophila Z-M001]